MSYYKAGSWNVVCDICGLRYKSDELQKNWKGQMVCKKDYEAKHPQLSLRIREENIAVPYTRPEVDITITGVVTCTATGRSSYAGYAIAGCSIAGLKPTL